MNLYTYLPKDNTADTEGLLSTRLAPSGWEKYKGRTGKDTKDEVLETLDSWEPGFARSNAISMFSEPIPEYADKRMVEFAKAKHLYSVELGRLIAKGIVRNIRASNTGNRRGTHSVKHPMTGSIDWKSKKPGKFLFSDVPHYLVETADGRIPPEYVTDEELPKDISFPEEEIDGLKGKDRIYTTRVSSEYGKYHKGDKVKSPWGDVYSVSDRKDMKGLDEHPYMKELTDEQKKLLSKFRRLAGITLTREKTAAPLPPQKLKFNTIRQWMNRLLKQTEGITPREMIDPEAMFWKDRKLDEVVKKFVDDNGIRKYFRQFSPVLKAEQPSSSLFSGDSILFPPRMSQHPFENLETRMQMFPRRAVYRGTLGVGGTVGSASDPSNAAGALQLNPVAGSQYGHVTSGPSYAEQYGLLNVFNARKVPGLINDRLKWFGNRGAVGVANSDLTAVRGLYNEGKFPFNSNTRASRRLDVSSPYYDIDHGSMVETLVDTNRIRPSRVYLKNGLGDYTDVTQLDRYMRTLVGTSAKDQKRRALVNSLIRSLRPPARFSVDELYRPSIEEAARRLEASGWSSGQIPSVLDKIQEIRNKQVHA